MKEGEGKENKRSGREGNEKRTKRKLIQTNENKKGGFE